MRRNVALVGSMRPGNRAASSMACLAFVAVLAVAFWAGAVWIVEALIRMASMGY